MNTSCTRAPKISASLFLLALLSFQTPAHAQFFSGAISSATGGAGRAAVDPLEAGLLNPAALAHIDQYNVGGVYFQSRHPKTGRDSGFGAIIADGTNVVPGSFSYIRKELNPEVGEDATAQDFQLSLSAAVYPGVSLGLSGHRLLTQTESKKNYAQNNLNVGALWVPTESFGFGLVGYDLIKADADIPEAYQTVPTYGLGFHAVYRELLRGRFDIVRPDRLNPNHRNIVMAGLETFFQQFLAFRIGGQWNDVTGQTLFTVGLGWKGPRLNASYSFQQDLRVSGAERHLFDMWLPF